MKISSLLLARASHLDASTSKSRLIGYYSIGRSRMVHPRCDADEQVWKGELPMIEHRGTLSTGSERGTFEAPRLNRLAPPSRWRIIALLLATIPFLLSCYTITLSLKMDRTGKGTAWIYAEYSVPEGEHVNAASLNQSLAELGWTTEPVTPAGAGKELASGFRSFSTGDLTALIRSVPGFENGDSTMRLIVEEDPAVGLMRYEFNTRLIMAGHINNWQSILDSAQEGISTDCNDTPLASPGEDCTIEITGQEMQQLIDQYGPPRFELKVQLPGKIETSVGPWTSTEPLTLHWNADNGADTISLMASTLQQPESQAPPPDVLAAHEQQILDRFTVELGNGQIVSNPTPIQNYLTAIFGPGRTNNLTNGQMNACGWWQGQVIRWLDSIRLNPDPVQQQLLAGLDYGPIQAYYGGHQAVVLFPKGTNWEDTGIVLDPWPEQIPQSFDIAQWKATFGIGSTLGGTLGIGPGQRHQDYPQLTGGPSSYPDTLTQAERLHFRRLLVNSPVNVLITGPGGARLGALPDGTLINEIPGADFYPASDSAPERVWYFGLPEGQYLVAATGVGDGDMHVLLAGDGSELLTYGAQPVSTGGTSTIELAPGLPLDSALVLENGERVTPRTATEGVLHEIYDDRAPTNTGNRWSQLLAVFGTVGLLAACCFGPVLAALGFYLFRQRRFRQAHP